MFLAHCSMPKAVEYVLSIYDSIPGLDEALQMSIIEVIRLDCKNDSTHRVCDPLIALFPSFDLGFV